MYVKVINLCSLFKLWVRRLLRGFALVSLMSVSLNTPKTFERYPFLEYFTIICDTICVLAFTAEMVAKMVARGIYKVTKFFI